VPDQRKEVDALSTNFFTLIALWIVIPFAAVFCASLDFAAQAQSTTEIADRSQSTKTTVAAEVGSRCVSCHRPYVESFLLETHGKTAKFLNDSRAAQCEACHGNGDKHIENRENRVVAQDIDNPTDSCLKCHSRDGTHFDWRGSKHDRSDMTCMSCHNVHHAKLTRWAVASRERAQLNGPSLDSTEIKFPDKMLTGVTVEETCLRCHTEQRKALFQRSTHLFRTELRNMKVGCTSCHNPHGGEAGKMLVEQTVNDVCYTCHAEKRGPFLWDHPPVRENCLNCHSPHGSSNPKLLTARVHLLCQQCHIHMLPRHSTTAGGPLDIWSLNRGCANCHGQVHGSNHPGGRTLTR
jgi:predicted CXXCH cytochrome family protein